MPTYEYACTKCGHQFEHFQSMKDAPLKKCPECGKPALKRLLGAGAGLIFKGTGFYITDYKNQPAAAPSSGDKHHDHGHSEPDHHAKPPPPFQGRPAPMQSKKSSAKASSGKK